MGQDLQFVRSFVILAAIKVACHCLIILSNMFIIVLYYARIIIVMVVLWISKEWISYQGKLLGVAHWIVKGSVKSL